MSIPEELRQAADKLTAEPHCGGIYSDCACDYAEQLAGLLRDYALMVDANPRAYLPPDALDIARRINKAKVIAAASVESAAKQIAEVSS